MKWVGGNPRLSANSGARVQRPFDAPGALAEPLEPQMTGKQRVLATMCFGVGQGIAMAIDTV